MDQWNCPTPNIEFWLQESFNKGLCLLAPFSCHPMHSPACPLTKTPIPHHLTCTHQHDMILLLCYIGNGWFSETVPPPILSFGSKSPLTKVFVFFAPFSWPDKYNTRIKLGTFLFTEFKMILKSEGECGSYFTFSNLCWIWQCIFEQHVGKFYMRLCRCRMSPNLLEN